MEVTNVNKIFDTKEEAIAYARHEFLYITSLEETEDGWRLEAWGPYGNRRARLSMIIAELLLPYRYI